MLIFAAQVMLVAAAVSLLLAALLSAQLIKGENWRLPTDPETPTSPASTVAAAVISPTQPPSPTPGFVPREPAATATLPPPGTEPTPLGTEDAPPAHASVAWHVGIVSGHAGYDPGTVCPDGLTEAEVNLTIAKIVVELLAQYGYSVDLLDEFDDRLSGYRADALVSIHADSCEVPGASGFKVARVTDSAIPEAEDHLVDCLYRRYEAVTGLPRHPNSITDNMTNYHAFREIDSYTPGAIIETGFLLEDQAYIVRRPRLIARGIAEGVSCFLDGTDR
jgi:N-acetylmuramoyl-L-alanine amidase